ncbi:MAG: hypothetical protein QW639_06625 [Candidatus Bathyarchaeia archaeon]
MMKHHERRKEVKLALHLGENTAFVVAEKITWRSVPWSLMHH